MAEKKPTVNLAWAVLPLTVLFTVLKLADKIQWSWWWVVSPIWISAGIALVVLMLVSTVMSSAVALALMKGVQKNG